MKKQVELLPPTMPNFVTIKQEPGKRQDGIKLNQNFPITDFTEKEAEEYGELMKQTFINYYKAKKNEN